jgi:hypothetical protein
MVKEPAVLSPKFQVFAFHYSLQTPSNGQIEFLIHGLTSLKKIHNALKSRVANNKEQAFIFHVHYDTSLSLWDYHNFHCDE